MSGIKMTIPLKLNISFKSLI